MDRTDGRRRADRPRRAARRTAAVAVAVAAAAVLAAGCGTVASVEKAARTVTGNVGTIGSFTHSLQASQDTPFSVTYQTSGSQHATVSYAVRPPSDLSFTASTTAGGSGSPTTHLIANATGQYSCEQEGGGTPTCEKLPASQASAEEAITSLYSAGHWVTFLEGLSVAAGLSGHSVHTTTMTVNGFALRCLEIAGTGGSSGSQTSTICLTAQGILGYVDVAGADASFSITQYSADPDPSLFELPAGATVVTLPT